MFSFSLSLSDSHAHTRSRKDQGFLLLRYSCALCTRLTQIIYFHQLLDHRNDVLTVTSVHALYVYIILHVTNNTGTWSKRRNVYSTIHDITSTLTSR